MVVLVLLVVLLVLDVEDRPVVLVHVVRWGTCIYRVYGYVILCLCIQGKTRAVIEIRKS
jgi:hypothetical protein